MELSNIAEFIFDFEKPIVCTAIHNGHFVSEKIKKKLAISEETQLREEDPFTEIFADSCGNKIIGRISRFEIDLNRSRAEAIYLKPADAWNLKVRKKPLTKSEIETSLKKYDLFYTETKKYLQKMKEKFGTFFVYDIHSYNYLRNGENAAPADPKQNPDIILGTNNMPEKWLPLILQIQQDLKNYDFYGKQLDVRINVKFSGGNFSRWIHRNFPNSACCVAIEFKKIFMNEWSGELYEEKILKLREALQSTFRNIEKKLKSG
ncbi:MAG: N-formylglutamate amidohydrolase [Candidatus Cloacimonadota bacterium]|nr:MAG: N-formylglutamate amidohydrolase [Candidatus Cloacimonadota bacterium]